MNPGDGRLHCVFNQLEAETGRTSSCKPNAQNLPQEGDVRACFICDPPNEDIRISVCCDEEAEYTPGPYVGTSYTCPKCHMPCDTKPEEYCIVTVDMSGAELRIIADLANAKSWIDAFNKGWDVHSVGTEILYPEKWPANTVRSLLNPNWWTLDTKELIPLFDDAGKPVLDKKTGLQKTVPPCAYYARDEKGDFARQKCECPKHKTLRNGNKSTNFLLCYGGGPSALADALGIAKGDAEDLYHLHESKFPDIWGYLKRSGQDARMKREARDMFGRRRLFPEPTWEQAKLWFMEEQEERLELDEELCEAQVLAFKKREFREPDEEDLWSLTHRMPSSKEISSSYKGLFASIERRGKNMPIQGTNASIIKRSMGCGIAADGTPYLWHTLPRFKAKLLSMVHDELVIHCPKRFGEQVAKLVADAFKRAAAEVLKHVVMEADWHIAERWTK